MANSDSDATYYIRVRGRVLGPYNVAQLKTLRGRGQFGRANEVSTDRADWQSAATIEHLLGGAGKAAEVRKTAEDTALAEVRAPSGPGAGPPVRSVQPAWHYSVGSEQYGPVTLLELRGLISNGQLTAADLVWKDGLADWTPLHDIAELNGVARPAAVGAQVSVASGTMALQAYCFACGALTDARAEVCPKCGVRQPHHAATTEKNRMTAALLALFLGGLGVHHFYLGNTGLGVLYLVFCWTFIPAIIAFIEFIVFLCMSDANFAAKYGTGR